MKAKSTLSGIQLLRGLACMLVFFYHVNNNATEKLRTDFLFNAFSFGKAGVDIFFVLSGFIIAYTSASGLSNFQKLGAFLRKRFVRIFPIYWLVLSMIIVVQQLIPTFFRRHLSIDFESLASSYLLLASHIPVNGLCVSWTLTFELFFYVLFSVGFIIPKLKWFLLSLLFFGVGIIAFAFTQNYFGHAYAMMQQIDGNKLLRIITSPLNIEFLLGVLAARLIPIHLKASITNVVIGSIAFMVSGIFVNVHPAAVNNDFNSVILFGVPSFFIIVGLVSLEQMVNFKIPRFFLILGDASYSLYLLHFPIVVASIKILSRFNLQNWLVIQLMLGVIIIAISYASILFYRFVEKPTIDRLNRVQKDHILSKATV